MLRRSHVRFCKNLLLTRKWIRYAELVCRRHFAILTSYMWAFATAANKVYDGTTAATLTLRGDPTWWHRSRCLGWRFSYFRGCDAGNAKAVNVSGGA